MSRSDSSATNRVFNILHRNIINLKLVPGSIMSEKDISERLKVSRTPVREAFIKLSNVGLVQVIPQKGSMVSKISLPRVKQERFHREALELSILEELILHKEDLNLTRLRKNLIDQEEALKYGDTTRFIELDDTFHKLLFQEADMALCYDMIAGFSGHYRRVRLLSMELNGGISSLSFKYHKDLVELIDQRDLTSAQKKMKEHLERLDIKKDNLHIQYEDYFEDDSPVIQTPEPADELDLV